MTPQYKAARDEKAWETFRVLPEDLSQPRILGFKLGADWGYAQGQAERQAERTAELALLAGQAEEIERWKYDYVAAIKIGASAASRAADVIKERDEWKQQAEKLLILAKHARGYPQDVLAAPKIVAEQLLAEYAAWKGEE